MPHVKLLQEWTTIQTAAGTTETVVQDEAGWLDLVGYDDIVIWSQIRSYSNINALNIETSPTKDDGWFTSMQSIALTAGSGPTIYKVIFASASTPLARYVRWKITSAASAGNITFRVWLVANPVGR
jgi:hypothetical protein